MTDHEFVKACKKAQDAGISMSGLAINKALKGKCPTCPEQVNPEDFRDELSVREFCISGMCMKCQDSVFGK